MRLSGDTGLWSTGVAPAAGPPALVLEVSGAVLSWPADGDAADPPAITFTDHHRADWLWRIVGESGHVALVEALRHRGLDRPVEVAAEVRPESTEMLRRLAFGHWLRRWWPASARDGIVALDGAVLAAEIALLTVAAEDYFTDDTLDSDVLGLLAPHLTALNALADNGDPRVAALVERCRELAAEIGLDWQAAAVPRRQDYALAAGGSAASPTGLIARGTASVAWSAVPPGVFDAAEDTIDWSVASGGDGVTAAVQVALSGGDTPAGIAVALRTGGCAGSGVLDVDGRAVLALRGQDGQPLTETQAWNQDWSGTAVRVGAEGGAEDAATRHRVRAVARARLAEPGAGAFLAEVLAAESDY
ncbi:hypothetical protein [Mycolicibacterium sp. HK-90]|uniref:hypothetical protein n=1 Tax=Mycolicibacterium sp. HK-90 TaxID=3056937 RepID=UPI0026595AD9|nr:hypothetical protein [Mycolicibacterium sp. HK-90]WKG01144.1 hypothetical protein QU592_17760 [Mycolicibacterium sp. HK-90]